MQVADIRREYLQGTLSEEEVLAHPMEQFEVWLEQAIKAELHDPTAMVVATVDPEGQPSQRIVLLKGSDNDGFVFFTNLGSRKAQELSQNNKLSLHFPWHALERQVIVYGEAEPLTTKENMTYFLSRPKESQLAAWASKQSHRVSSRQMLMQTFEKMKEKFNKGDIPTPDFWGGYRVKPHKVEFWQGGEHRLHDRILYIKSAESWETERLAP